MWGKTLPMERAKNLILVSAGYISGENLLEFFKTVYQDNIFTTSLLFFRFVLCILQMAFAFFHILFFMMEHPPRYTSRSTYFTAFGISVITLAIGIWNIVYHAKYRYSPFYDIFFELLMMALIPLEAFLFVFYLKTDEALSQAQATLSGPAKNSYLASNVPFYPANSLNPQQSAATMLALNATREDAEEEGSTILVDETTTLD